MKTKLIVSSIFSVTAITVLAFAAQEPLSGPIAENVLTQQVTKPQQLQPRHKPKIELVFALDTTGSMSGLIQAAKEKIWSIASTMAAAKTAPEISIGLVAYRDRGDAYVTRITDLSTDLDSVYAALLDFKADGGGDGPESVNAALNDAVTRMSWSNSPNAYKVIFLVGDAPGHNDYQDDVPYTVSVAEAARRGIIVNTIQAGQDQQTTIAWQAIARLGQGNMFKVDHQGSALAVATPFDADIALASRELDSTKIYFGDRAQKARQAKKHKATEKLYSASSTASLARRAKFNLSESGEENLLGRNELVDALESGKLQLADIKPTNLPAAMQAMAVAEQEAFVKRKATQRKDAKKQLKILSDKRDAFIKQRLAKTEGTEHSLDEQLFVTLRAQAGMVGLDYANSESSY